METNGYLHCEWATYAFIYIDTYLYICSYVQKNLYSILRVCVYKYPHVTNYINEIIKFRLEN